jgi:hypothetical protein
MNSYFVQAEAVSFSETVNFDHIIHLHIIDGWISLLKMETVNSFVTLTNVYHIHYDTSQKTASGSHRLDKSRSLIVISCFMVKVLLFLEQFGWYVG